MMAAPGSEEVGFKRISLSSSAYNAVIPIKKRRFPSVDSPPSPSKETSSFNLNGNLIVNEQPSLSEDPAISDSSVVPTLGSSVECDEKSEVTKNYALHALPERPVLKLSSTKPDSDSRGSIKVEGIDRKKTEENCIFPICKVEDRSEFSVGLKGHIVPDLVPERSDWNCPKQKSLEPVLLDLSLRKQGSSSQCVIGNVRSEYEGSLLHSKRENWDLNTSMEFWEGCSSDAAAPQPVTLTNATVGTNMCSTEKVDTDGTPGKQGLLDSEHRPNLSNAGRPSNNHLHLRFNSSDVKPTSSQDHDLSFKLDLGKATSNLALFTRPVQLDGRNVDLKDVKSEPFVESCKLNFKSGNANDFGLSKEAIVKCEIEDQCNLETGNSLNSGRLMKIVEPKMVRTEIIYDSKHGAHITAGGVLNPAEKHVLPEIDNSCPVAIPVTEEMTHTARNSSCSTDLTMSNHSKQLTHIETPPKEEVHREGCDSGVVVSSEMINLGKEQCIEDSSIISAVKTSRAEDQDDQKTVGCPLKLMNEQLPCLQGSREGYVSDEEKISISADMLEDDSYITEYESDGNYDLAEDMDPDDKNAEEDYEDGEVREPLLKVEVEDHACETREVRHFDYSYSDDKVHSLDPVEQDIKSVNLDVRSEDGQTKSKPSKQENENLCVKELHMEESTIREDVHRLVEVKERSQLTQFDERNNSASQDTFSDKAIDGIQDLVVTVSQGEEENVITVDTVPTRDEAVSNSNTKESVNSDDSTKDVNGGSNNNRIINLARASTAGSPPCKTKPIFVRSVLSQTNSESVPDIALEGDNLRPHGRDNTYSNITKKISVDRHQDQSQWMNFTHRRGRNNNRSGPRRGDWNYGPEFSQDNYNNQMEYRVPNHKYASAPDDDFVDESRYKIIPDGPFGGTSRRGRQMPDDVGPFFFHGPSRRKSPGRRHGPHVRGGKMVNRIPRDFSPTRCMDEDGPEFVGRQHGEKFTRNFADETMDPMYARPRPPYEVDRPFFHERRNFSFQRKGFPRMDSKSPVRSKARSPSQWFSSKRPDRFYGRPDMMRRRSPDYRVDRMRSPDFRADRMRSPDYRADRMRSPDQHSIRGDMDTRRHRFHFVPPPSNDLRDMGPVRDRSHMRSIIPNRNQNDRSSLRNRRYDVIDPRGRIENDEFFDGSVHSDQLNEHTSGDHEDDERRFNKRHEPHSFKPPYNDSDGERFHNNPENCFRPFRFCAENDLRFS